MANFRNYDPRQIVFTFKGLLFRGYAEGTFIKVERAVDGYSMAVGSNGDVVRTRSRNRTGSITVTLQGASITNDELSGLVVADEISDDITFGVGAAMGKDLNGLTVFASQNAWIRKVAPYEAAMEHTNREWILDCSELRMFVGGALR